MDWSSHHCEVYSLDCAHGSLYLTNTTIQIFKMLSLKKVVSSLGLAIYLDIRGGYTNAVFGSDFFV